MVKSNKKGSGPKLRNRFMDSEEGECHWCGNPVSSRFSVLMFAIPICIGGSVGTENKRLTCPACKKARSENIQNAFQKFTLVIASKRKNLIRGAVVRCYHNPMAITSEQLIKTLKTHTFRNKTQLLKYDTIVTNEKEQMKYQLKNLQKRYGKRY